jgi:hypothetical protein
MQFETWSLEECGCLVAGIDPLFPLNANGPLVPIEKTSIGMIDALIQSAAGASLDTLPADSDRVLQKTFVEWAKDNLDKYLQNEFRVIFLGERDRSLPIGFPQTKTAQIRGPEVRRGRLLEFLEKESIETDPLLITKEHLRQWFFESNPDIAEVVLATFAADLKELGIKGKAGHPSST